MSKTKQAVHDQWVPLSDPPDDDLSVNGIEDLDDDDPDDGPPAETMASAPDGFMGPVLLDLTEIDIRPASQVRVTTDGETVDRYADCLNDLPPVRVFADGAAKGGHWLGDGHCRLRAHRAKNKRRIKCLVKTGTYHDAYTYACHANDAHGLPATKGDKEHRVKLALENREKLGLEKATQAVIADFCGVHQTTVSEVQRKFKDDLKLNQGPKKGKDGKDYPTVRKPRKPKPKDAPTPPPDPEDEARKAAVVEAVSGPPEGPVAKAMRELAARERERVGAAKGRLVDTNGAPLTSDRPPDAYEDATAEERAWLGTFDLRADVVARRFDHDTLMYRDLKDELGRLQDSARTAEAGGHAGAFPRVLSRVVDLLEVERWYLCGGCGGSGRVGENDCPACYGGGYTIPGIT